MIRIKISEVELLKIRTALHAIPNVTVDADDGDLRIELGSYGNEIALETFVTLNHYLNNHPDLIGKYESFASCWADGEMYGGIGGVYLLIWRKQ